MKNKTSLLLFLSFLVAYLPFSALGFSLDQSTPMAELVKISEEVRPELTRKYKAKFKNLAQMCRHAHNMRYPSQAVETIVETPKLGATTGVMTKHNALKRERQLNGLSEQLMKAARSMSFELSQLFPDKVCHHQLFNFSPEMMIKQKLAGEMAGLRELIKSENFKGCAEYIEQRAGL